MSDANRVYAQLDAINTATVTGRAMTHEIGEWGHDEALAEIAHLREANIGLNDAYARVVRERDQARAALSEEAAACGQAEALLGEERGTVRQQTATIAALECKVGEVERERDEARARCDRLLERIEREGEMVWTWGQLHDQARELLRACRPVIEELARVEPLKLMGGEASESPHTALLARIDGWAPAPSPAPERPPGQAAALRQAKELLRVQVAGHPDGREHWRACPACQFVFSEPGGGEA